MRLLSALGIIAAVVFTVATGSGAVAAERRLALVIGESAYAVKPIATAANDAGLIAQTLQAAGFDVTGARDLDEAALKQSFRDFLDKVSEAGPDAVAFVYFSGYGLQLEGENYLVSVDAKITRDVDIPMRALRVSDYLKPLAASEAKLTVVVLNAARANPFQLSGEPLAGGLALYEPGPKALLAYNAAPGTNAPEATGDYGTYAHALAEMIRDGGRPLMEVFENTRLRVSDVTKGAQVPWNSQRVETGFVFFQREAGAPARVEDTAKTSEPIGKLGPDDGYSAALRQDTLQGYEDYVTAYPSAPYAKRARAILAARREALTWRRTRMVDSPNAYWSYLRRYPKGPHSWDARRRLAEMRYDAAPPPSFDMIDYGFPPPPPEEIVYVQSPVVIFDDPMWGFVPPPPPPIYFLPPPPPNFIVLPPPIIIAQPYVLPVPVFVPIPVWQSPPPYIAPPPTNFIYTNIHNTVVVDPAANNVVARNPAGGVISTGALTAVGAGAAVAAVGAALPPVIAKRNPPPAMTAPPGVGPGGATIGGPAPIGAPVQPGAGGAPLPKGATPAEPLGAPLGREAQPLPKGPGAPSTVIAPQPQERSGGAVDAKPAPALPKGEALPKPAPGGVASPGVEQPGRGLAPKDHALPVPGGPASEHGAAQPGRPQLMPAEGPKPAPGSKGIAAPPPASGAPAMGAGERRAPPSVGHGPSPGLEAPLAGPGHAPPQHNVAPPRQAAPQGGLDGAPVHQHMRPRDPNQGSPFGGRGPSGGPPQMREPMGMMPQPAQPRMRPMQPQGMPPQGMSPHGAAPPPAHAPQFRAGPPAGMPPQMHQMAPPPSMAPQPMHAPQPQAPAMMRPAAPPPQAVPMMRPAGPPPGPHGGGPGGPGGPPPGFGGMR